MEDNKIIKEAIKEVTVEEPEVVAEELTKEQKKELRKAEREEDKKQRKEDLKAGMEVVKTETKQAVMSTIDPNGDKDISFGEIFGEMFNIHKDVASKYQIQENLVSGGKVSGTNMCLLVLAILIASIGLNVNSTAVIIGAMLISPLMGTIHATAYGTASSNLSLTVRSLLGFISQIAISLITSTIYFLISPLSGTTSELLARTQPTIWDVLIAICGGIAGIIGVTRKEKTNVIPGVAIATALMPPLCTCGYSIANGQWKMLLGAGYLFTVNSYFIFLSAMIILIILGVPKVREVDKKRQKRMRNAFIRNSILMIIPSIIVAFFMLREATVDGADAVMGFETTVDVALLDKEAKVLFPEIEDISVGREDYIDEEGTEAHRKVIYIDTVDEAEVPTEKIENWLNNLHEDYMIEWR